MKLSLLLQIGALATLAPVVATAQEAPAPSASPATEATAPATPPKAPPTVEVTVPPGCVLRPNAAGEPTVYCERDATTNPPPARRWYGGYVLAADGASLLVGLTGALLPPMALVGFGGYLVGAPIVHWSRGHVGKGFASMGLRFGSIAATAVLGTLLAEPNCSGRDFAGLCALIYVAPLVTVGMVAATTIDAAVLAREDVEAPPRDDARRAPAPRRAAITLVPTLALTPTVQQAGVGGTF